MQIDPSSKFSGYPILDVRRFVAQCKGFGFYTDRIAMLMNITQAEADIFVRDLAKAGYIEPSSDGDNDDSWIVTKSGNAFAMASASKPLLRKSCDRILKEFLNRVEEIENMPFVANVGEVYLFGSYARGAERPSDIDLYVNLVYRSNDTNERNAMFTERKKVALRNGRTFSNIGEECCWPSTEILMYLKNRSRAISMTTADSWVVDDPDSILIYQQNPRLRIDPPYDSANE